MPTSLTSSFASAAAGGNSDNANRRDGSGGNEWSRNRSNGATQTFRRVSQATTSTQPRENPQSQPPVASTGPYIPPHLNTSQSSGGLRNGVMGDARYTKEQLLNIYQSLKQSESLDRNLRSLFTGPWDATHLPNGSSQKTEARDQTIGPEVCWNGAPQNDPVAFTEFSEAEKQLFASVNSPLKLNSKEGTNNPVGTRKSSVSNAYGSTPGSRPGTRRRETSDSFTGNGPMSPTESKPAFRNETTTSTPPPSLLRRKTDYKEEDVREDSKEEGVHASLDDEIQTPFASLRRAGTGPINSGLTGPSSPWSTGPHPSAFGSMGSFGNFAVGSAVGQEQEKRPGFGSAKSTSRFKDLLAKSSVEDMSPSVKEKSSFGALEKLPEEEADMHRSKQMEMLKTRPTRSETNPYDNGIPRSGSAALSAQDNHSVEQMGFSAFGPPGNVGAREFGHGDPGVHHTPQGRSAQEQFSPTNTNPFHSPQVGRGDGDDDEDIDTAMQQTGPPAFGNTRRDVFPGSETRPGFGSVRGMSGLGGLGGGWGASGFGGTPGRPAVSAAFGDSIFSPIGEIPSPSAAALGSGSFFGGPSGFASAGRSSRLGALFPPAMQDQMRSDSRNDAFGGRGDMSGRDPFESGNPRNDSFRNFFNEEAGRPGEEAFGQQPQINIGPPHNAAPGPPQRTSVPPEHAQSGHNMSQSSGSNSSNQMPAAQQRQMVMPDRMRWVYRDPLGNVQGPWSGLEMHDWFKAGFFTAELQVKKLEDAEYEPLAQLVRRIGNSREPFLVPQIGVPHGQPSANQGNHWATGSLGGAGAAQPPFANSFPSFGTTLTAEQQNALERRKQEEQFLMARQKEHLAQQQVYMKQMQMQNPAHGMHSLQHHSSAHSLHSQPSFGSITSPAGYQPSSMQAPIQPPQSGPNFGGVPAGSNVPHSGRDDDLPNHFGRMGFNDRSNVTHGASPLAQGQSQQSISSMLHDRETHIQHPSDMQAHQSTFLGEGGRNERLEEFQELRGEMDQDELQAGEGQMTPSIGGHRGQDDQLTGLKHRPAPIGHGAKPRNAAHSDMEPLSLTQQVQRTAAAHKQAATDISIEAPPLSISPLPAPAAQRNRLHVADALAAESRSATQTPVEAPSASIAPWAEKSAEVTRGPSLKEIQEAEAKRAAEQEELMAAARRAQAEHERLTAPQAPVVTPGLPSSSNWASSASPSTPTLPGQNVWAKQATKPAPTNSTAKKTLAQIQKEEESRKVRAAVQAAAQAQTIVANSPVAPSGSRYAQMAGKIAPPAPQVLGSAWTTVGSSGKPKTPSTVVATPQVAGRVVSSGNVPVVAKARPTLPTVKSTLSGNTSKANEEFKKWYLGQLGKGLNSGINVDSFFQDLLVLPMDIDIVNEAVYLNSKIMDSRRFSEEFIRRRKLAEKGVIEPSANGAVPAGVENKSGTGEWSEVAKKGPVKEETNPGFKVVATKKKSKR